MFYAEEQKLLLRSGTLLESSLSHLVLTSQDEVIRMGCLQKEMQTTWSHPGTSVRSVERENDRSLSIVLLKENT